MSTHELTIPVPWAIRIRHLLTDKLQGWLFAANVVAVAALWLFHQPGVVLMGQVETHSFVVPATRDGVLESTEQSMRRFDLVEKGITAVARIDVTNALLEMQQLTAERQRLLAQLESERQQIRREQLQWQWQIGQEKRQLQQQEIDVHRSRLSGLQRIDDLSNDLNDLEQSRRSLALKHEENQASIRTAQIAIESLHAQRDAVEELIRLKMAPATQRVAVEQELQLQQESLASAQGLAQLIAAQSEDVLRRVSAATDRLATARTQAGIEPADRPRFDAGTAPTDALPMKDATPNFDSDALLEPFVQAIAVQDAKIRILANEIASNEIIAPESGTIAEVHQQPGTFVRKGDPILTITSSQKRWVVAYVDQRHQHQIRQGAKVTVRMNGTKTFVATSSVTDLGNQYESVPPQLRQNVEVAQWGLPIKVPVPAGVDVTPGQRLDLIIH